ncbi:hypothetical protein RRG08_024697 [Elysia crispata]|uniref:Uncharacterized protein n=1 Tax=Elysia crispata TaxID=231223 RepID=A0AAE1CX02_9GAST|nr:hypothetical protein RRG08_024697 [Elysia crispata]
MTDGGVSKLNKFEISEVQPGCEGWSNPSRFCLGPSVTVTPYTPPLQLLLRRLHAMELDVWVAAFGGVDADFRV